MAVTQIDYPVTGEIGTYKNLFPSQKPLYMNFNRKDAIIDSIVSGVDGNVRIAITGTFENIEIDQTVIWQTDGYGLNAAQVVSIIDPSTIEVNVPFDSANAANGFINYHLNWFLELRYVRSESVTDSQTAIQILDDFSQIPSSLNGNVRANIGLPSDLINADFTLTGLQNNLFIEYKIQYRQSYEAQRTLNWVSPSLDIPILLVHATVDLTPGFTDMLNVKRFIKGYPLNYMIVYSNVNDAGNNTFNVILNEYALDKSLIQSVTLDSISNLNGVYNLLVDTNTLDEGTRFIDFESQLITNNGQYDSTQYDPTQYA